MWGKNMVRLGVAPAALPHHKLTTSWLTKTIERLLSDAAMIGKAKALGETIRSEDGTGVAVSAIEAAMARAPK